MTTDRAPDAGDFEAAIRAGEEEPIVGWDFRFLAGRWELGSPDWDLRAILRERIRSAGSLLDLGTGGGEFLASLAPLPRTTVATEGYRPNLPVARQRLEPLGVRVLPVPDDRRIPLASASMELVHSRHEAFDPSEVARVLVPGGTFVTQQVGGENYLGVRERFGVPPERPVNRVESLAAFSEEVARAGLSVEVARESRFPERFRDVGAVVCFLRAAPWEVPGFSVERFRPVLASIHAEIVRTGSWELTAHRLLVVARKAAR